MSKNAVFNWKITNVEAIMSYSSLTNVVRSVYWICEGTDDDNKYGRHWGIEQLDVDNINPETFISYSSLTSSQVTQWVKDSLNRSNPPEEGEPAFTTKIEQSIETQMDSEEIGSRITGIPWS